MSQHCPTFRLDAPHVPSAGRRRLRPASAGEFPGTGIGLTTVHRIVDRHGGGLRVDAAVVMVTHEPDMAQHAGRIIRFLDGRVAADTVAAAAA